MWKRLCQAASVVGVVVLTGCIEATTMVYVTKDGSGSIVETVYLGAAAQQMMQQMTAGMGGEGGAQMESSMPLDAEACKAKARKMGEGVRFVSVEEATKPDGSSGAKAIYAFDDVSKLTLNPNDTVETPGPQPPGGSQEEKPITFDFDAADPAVLTVHMPPPDDASEGAEGQGAPNGGMAEGAPNGPQMAQMKQMFEGFRVRILVKTEGDIVRSNAAHVWAGSRAKRKQYVTLLDFNIGALISDAAAFEKLAAAGTIRDMDTAMAKLQDIPGLKIETAREVEIAFQ